MERFAAAKLYTRSKCLYSIQKFNRAAYIVRTLIKKFGKQMWILEATSAGLSED